jgi:hypothetical protein
MYFVDKTISIPVQLNEFIDAFPTNYFVKIYFDEIISENLGPSDVPLTLLFKQATESNQSLSVRWCHFFPISSFIGVRSVKTVNLIFTNVTECCFSYRSPSHQCKFLNFASGSAFEDPEIGSCVVQVDQTITLVLAEQTNKAIISNDAKLFWNNFSNRYIPNYIILFYSSFKPFSTDICEFEFFGNDVFMHCAKVSIFSASLLSNKPAPLKRWYTGMSIDYSPKTNSSDPSVLNELYNNQPTEEFLITEILRKANESGRYVSPSPTSSVSNPLQWEVMTFIGQHVLVDNTQTGFLSCYSTPRIKFTMYLKPFRLEVWISLVLCCSLIAGIIGLYNRKFKLSQSFNPFFFFFSTLLEEPYSVPRKLWNSRIFKSFTATWLLTAILFTNLYIGLMITDVVAPLQGDVLKTFDEFLLRDSDLLNQHLYSLKYDIFKFWKYNYSESNHGSHKGIPPLGVEGCNVSFSSKDYENHHAQFRGMDSFALLQSPLKTCAGKQPSTEIQQRVISHPWMYGVFSKFWNEMQLLPDFYGNSTTVKLMIGFFSGRNRHYPKDPKFAMQEDNNDSIPLYLDAAIEKEIVDCGQSVFMGNKDDLKYELAYLRTYHPQIGFYVSKDSFEKMGLKPNIWAFENAGNSRVPYYFKQLIEAGIRQFIISLRKHTYYLVRRKGSRFVQLSRSNETHSGTTGSIQTIFFIWMTFCIVSTAVFLFEFCPKVWSSISSKIRKKNTILKCLESNKFKMLVITCHLGKFAKQLKLGAVRCIRRALKGILSYQCK